MRSLLHRSDNSYWWFCCSLLVTSTIRLIFRCFKSSWYIPFCQILRISFNLVVANMCTLTSPVGLGASRSLDQVMRGQTSTYSDRLCRHKLVLVMLGVEKHPVFIIVDWGEIFPSWGWLKTSPPIFRYFHKSHFHIDRGLFSQGVNLLLQDTVTSLLKAQCVIIDVRAVKASPRVMNIFLSLLCRCWALLTM